ncbi:ATP-binding cassette domain-containing protein [Paraflavitalea sp. CAU 1676]|uniref:ATP-binding cassette domain-containing protein n=1 Tax=Paraflavitalea sp. CAU 1676 TaxID=3032598 RepID=UPI0023DC6761|nr:ATP-binding cassette domain-containing protein [Paraflavitalea sp. CAU 1676]MDF2191880.1 ATP-binding cassette domain-containing protein [Paraflavitalea sp. CAU 1676]
MADHFLQLDGVSVKLGAQQVLDNINLTILPGQHWAITGESGSGKTVLAHTLAGRHFYSGHINASFGTPETYHHQIIIVEQQHRFKDLTNRSDFYYQQRFNSFDAEQTATVGQLLADYITPDNQQAADRWIAQLQIGELLQEPVIQLSNGENKRLQLTIALLQHPQLLVLDNPFVGLDVNGRAILHDILGTISQTGIHLLLITTPEQLSPCITHVATLEKGVLTGAVAVADYVAPKAVSLSLPIEEAFRAMGDMQDTDFTTAIRMKNVSIQYEGKHILQDVHWAVQRGDRWCVSGANGAGKSTLLSLITGDNPQAYANEIYLFDRRRGSGESIWDIKRKTGYVSPEMHLYFDYTAACYHAIASGLFDTIGLFRQLTPEQDELVHRWISLMGLEKKAHHGLSRLSAGEQRLTLLARALIKHPALLILDEPCQGLDAAHTQLFRNLVDAICAHSPTTLVYVSHYREEIPSCVDKFLTLDKGRATITG